MTRIPFFAGTLDDATPSGAAVDSVAEPALQWTMDPWREHTRRAMVGVVLAILLAALVFTAVGGRLTGLLLASIAIVSLAPAFLVVHCRVDGAGVSRTILGLTERRAWADIRRARLGAGALRVGPSRRPGVLDGFRTLTLPLPGGAPAALSEALRRRIEDHGL